MTQATLFDAVARKQEAAERSTRQRAESWIADNPRGSAVGSTPGPYPGGRGFESHPRNASRQETLHA